MNMDDSNARRSFSALVAAAFVDGKLSEPERIALQRKAVERSIPTGLVRELLRMGEQGRLTIEIPSAPQDRNALLHDLIDVVCADGRVEASEHHAIAQFASRIGIALPDLRARVRERMQK